jgi:protein-tyrosine kinase
VQQMRRTTEVLWHADMTSHEATPAPASQRRHRQSRTDYSHAQTVKLDAAVLREHRVLTGNAPRPFAESCHQLRTQILHRFRENGWNSLAITSPREGAGKTLTAINLAISMARMIGYSVLLVDANLHRPAILEHLGLPESRGLGDYLADDMPVENQLIRSDHFDDLVIFPGGQPLNDAGALLNSQRMKQLIRYLKSRARNHMVILDLPPVLACTEASAIARQMDAALLVIEDGVTTRQDAQHAAGMLGSAHLAGTVLNKVCGT